VVDRLNPLLRTPKRLSPEAVRRLETQPWPGNVRALENAIGRSMLLAEGDVVEAKDLALGPVDGTSTQDWPTPHEGFSLETFLRSARKHLMLKAIEMTNGNRAAAARLLGLTPQAVSRFMKQEDDQAAQM
jgi:DNA-binding NtrC family response regulator